MPLNFIYVLHFDDKLEHAQHYIGCTSDLKERLKRHASGRGAKIVSAAMTAGITWRIGGLYTTTGIMLRTIERKTKNQNNSKRYCEHCNDGLSNRIPCATPYSLKLLEFPLNSADISYKIDQYYGVTYDISRVDNENWILKEVLRISNKHKNELGFIPMSEEAGIKGACNRGQIYYAKRDNKMIGYCLFSRNIYELVIHQICVNDADKGCGIGKTLIENIEANNSEFIMRCSVREDLAANGFWLAIGFKETGRIKHVTSGTTLIRYQGLDRINMLTEINSEL